MDAPILAALDKEIAGLEARLAETEPPFPFTFIVDDAPDALAEIEEEHENTRPACPDAV